MLASCAGADSDCGAILSVGGSSVASWIARSVTTNTCMVFSTTFAAAVLGAALRYAMMCKAVKAQPLLLNDLYTRWYLLMSHTVHSSMVTFAVYTTQFAFSCPLRVWLTSC